jgi:hypothetical protein
MHAHKSALYRFATVWSTCATLSLSSKQEYPMQPRTQMVNEQTTRKSRVVDLLPAWTDTNPLCSYGDCRQVSR